MSIFKLSTGAQVQSTGSAEMGGGNMEPIPEGTKVKAAITDVSWATVKDSEEQFVKVRWDVLDGEYKKRVIFQKIRVNEADPKKADKHRMMLAAIDTNAGGKLQKLAHEPGDIDLQSALTNKPMLLRLGVWEMEGNNGPMSGNWVQQVESGRSSAPAPASAPKPAASAPKAAPKPAPAPVDDAMPEDGDIPF